MKVRKFLKIREKNQISKIKKFANAKLLATRYRFQFLYFLTLNLQGECSPRNSKYGQFKTIEPKLKSHLVRVLEENSSIYYSGFRVILVSLEGYFLQWRDAANHPEHTYYSHGVVNAKSELLHPYGLSIQSSSFYYDNSGGICFPSSGLWST